MNQRVAVAVHDEEFYLDDGDFVLGVENTLFKVIFLLGLCGADSTFTARFELL
jgi:hypothetical protein